MRTVYIEDNTPEGRWLLDLIKDHKSVTVAPKVTREKKNESSWDRAIATGAMSLEEFDIKFTEAVHQAYK